MKISQKQAQLLAREIINQLKSKRVQKVSDSMKEQLKAYVEKRNILKQKDKAINEEISKHESTLFQIVGKLKDRIWSNDSLSDIIAKVEDKTLPTLSEIEDEIILKSMFQSEDDMQKFVDSVVNKYSKKLQSKILSN